MRNQWRLIQLGRTILSSSPSLVSRKLFTSQVNSFTTCKTAVVLPTFSNSTFTPLFHRFYSTKEQPVSGKSPETSLVIDIFAKELSSDEIKKELDDNRVIVTRDLINEVLKHLSEEPGTGIKFFNWVLERDVSGVLLESNSYNLMLGILGGNGYVKEFWDMLDVMKKKGFGIKGGARQKVLEKFDKDGLKDDLERLEGLFVKKVSTETTSSRISRIVRKEDWSESVEKELSDLGVGYSSELVKMVLEKLAFEPSKGLIFFRWLEESGLFKHDQTTYNTMAVVLGREDCIDTFWNVVGDMRNAGFEMEKKTYLKVLGRFVDRKMLNDAVGLYELMLFGVNKPSHQDCTFLLRKLATAKELDIELMSRVVTAFTEKGLTLDDCILDSVLKSLTSVRRLKECKKVLDVMVEGGFKPTNSMQARVAFDLSSSKLKDEADEVMENLEGHGFTPDYKTWSSLIEGHCVAGDLEKARGCFSKMIDKKGVQHVGYPLDMIVNSYCNRYRGAEARRLLSSLVNNKSNVEPWHITYKTLITKLLGQRGFKDALPLLGLMKRHGFPPFLEPFFTYLSLKGTPQEAIQFFGAVTVKKNPSNKIYLQVFEAFSKSGRHQVAQDVLAKCPKYIRNNADVLNIFCSMKSEQPAEPEVASVAA